MDRSERQEDPLLVDLLEADDEHRPVMLFEDRPPDLNDIVRADREEESIERGVVELAERDALLTSGSPSGSRSGMMCAASSSS
jgi:hypothetical protein